jgi:23S rRNA pseudouridine1911/1915/1917 synthase
MKTDGAFHWTFKVDESLVGERADKALFATLKDEEDLPQTLSRTQIQSLMHSGKISLNGSPLLKSVSLKLGDFLELWLEPPTELDLTPIDLPLDILFEDAHLLFVNKPSGISVHPSDTENGPTLVHILLHHIRDLSGIGGKLRPGIVHRLDKFTSGVMVISKSNEAHQKLVEAFQAHEHERRYWAFCYGAPETWGAHPKKLETKIGRDPSDRKRMSCAVKEGKSAVSQFLCLEKFRHGTKTPFASLIEASLHTGRTHQVRVHLTHLQHSLLGDSVYGRPTHQQPKWKILPEDVQKLVTTLPGQALHARVLGIKHPITGENLRIEAPLPPHLSQLLDTLRKLA